MKILKFRVNRIDLKGNKLKDQIMEIASVTNTYSSSKEHSLFVYVEGKLVTVLQVDPEVAELIMSNSDINLNKFTLNSDSLAFKVVVPKDAYSEVVNYHYYTPVHSGIDFRVLLASALNKPLKVGMDLDKLASVASSTTELIDIVNSEHDRECTKLTYGSTALSKYTENLTEEDLVLLISILQDLIDNKRRQ